MKIVELEEIDEEICYWCGEHTSNHTDSERQSHSLQHALLVEEFGVESHHEKLRTMLSIPEVLT
jgi:protein-arginine kinase activator protein McsA